jgi:hypothetical protein
MSNSIYTLHPYKHGSQWVFDDESKGLFREAFVAGIDDIIEYITKDFADAKNGFNLLFSDNKFPSANVELHKQGTESGGTWYYCPQLEMAGWLCPALFKYYDVAPETIYIQVKE